MAIYDREILFMCTCGNKTFHSREEVVFSKDKGKQVIDETLVCNRCAKAYSMKKVKQELGIKD